MSEQAIKIAVVGATGAVGQEMLALLETRNFPAREVRALASHRSAGETVPFGERALRVEEANEDTLRDVDLVLMSAGSDVSRALAPLLRTSGALVVDNSSAFRMDEDVPLVVPEVNADALEKLGPRRLVANPNCSTIQMVLLLAPLARVAGLKRVVVSTYQAVSGAGRAGMEELGTQVSALFAERDLVQDVFKRRIAFNCLPKIDSFAPDGETREEVKMRQESQKILSLPELKVSATCVRVPVFNGHGLSLNVELAQSLSADEARRLFERAPGVRVDDNPQADLYPTPVDAEGQDLTLVGRIREDRSVLYGLNLWCVADNLRKGAATNAIQIAEAAAARGLLRP